MRIFVCVFMNIRFLCLLNLYVSTYTYIISVCMCVLLWTLIFFGLVCMCVFVWLIFAFWSSYEFVCVHKFMDIGKPPTKGVRIS